MRLPLLKSAIYSDLTADNGRQVFAYALYPHGGCFATADTVRAAYMLNSRPWPCRFPADKRKRPCRPLFACQRRPGKLFPETVKQAEGDEAIVVRLYECKNRKTPLRLTFGFPIAAAFLCDMEENNLSSLAVEKTDTLALCARPFDILTVKVYPQKIKTER